MKRPNDKELLTFAQNGDLNSVRLLIEAGAEVNVKNEYYETALILAAKNAHTVVVETLINAGADMNAKDHFGRTPLMWAICRGHATVVNMLLKAGARSGGIPSLHMASACGEYDEVKTLLQTGVNVNAVIEKGSDSGTTALMMAAVNGHTTVLELLLQAGQTQTRRNGTILRH